MKSMFRYLKRYKKECILGPLFKLLEAVFELSVPLVVAALIDHGIGGANTGYIVRMCLLLVAFGAVGLICSLTAQYFAARAAVGFATSLRSDLFRHIMTFSYENTDRIGSSTLITRLSADTAQVQSGVNLGLRLLLRSPFVVFGAMIMAFTVDAPSAVVFAGAIPILSLIVFGIMLLSIPLYRAVQAKLDGVTLAARENLTGVRVLRAFSKEEEEIRSFRARCEELNFAQRKVSRVSSLLNPLTYVIINFAVIMLIYTGALRVDSGNLSQGQLIALYNYMSQILVELIKLANLIITLTRCAASCSRIRDVLLTSPAMSAPASDTYTENHAQDRGLSVCMRHVSLRYAAAGADALCDLNFDVSPGQTVGIIGGTGSGKTSLVNLIARFYDATQGEVLLGDKNVRDYPLEVLRKKVGVVAQKAVLFAGSVRDNMRFGNPDATDAHILCALRIAQADGLVRDKGGLDAQIEQNGSNLSGGQRQRLCIARALVANPQVLILDDSSSALDFATDAALRRALRSSLEGTTVFIVSQRTGSLLHADRILVMEDGAIVGQGTHDELLRTCEVYRQIHRSQFSEDTSSSIPSAHKNSPVSASASE